MTSCNPPPRRLGRRCARGLLVFTLLAGVAMLEACAAGVGAPIQDRLEPGLQGQPVDGEIGILPQPFSRGVSLVGHAEVGSGRDSNIQMAWIDHCAYISSIGVAFMPFGMTAADPAKEGVAVIDVSDPSAPVQTELLRGRGSIDGSETMHAVQAADRRVLASGSYHGGHDADPAKAAFLDIYDASDCAHPKHMAEFVWPENAHALTISPNGRRIYGTTLDPFTGAGGIMVVDISDMSHPRYIGKFRATAPDDRSWEFAPHEISISPDERRIYAGVVGSLGGDLNADITSPPGRPSAARVGRDAGGIYILDNSDIAEGRPDPLMRLIGTAQHGGWHSVAQANINGAPYLVAAGELLPCPGTWPKVVSIADETHPEIVGEFRLAMNHQENCPPPTAIETQTAGIVGRMGTATIHFNDVDNPHDTRLGLFNFLWSGLRIVDLRNPVSPHEVAYFRPGDACGGHVRYIPARNEIWLSCAASGFYVLRLDPRLAHALDLDTAEARKRRP